MCRSMMRAAGGAAATLAVLALLGAALAPASPAGAMPPRPVPFDENGNRVAAGEPAAVEKTTDPFPYDLFNGKNMRTTGTITVPVLLVDFAGMAGRTTPTQFTNILFTPSPGGNTSLRDYYGEVSRSQLIVTGQVYGWFRMPRAYSSYVMGMGGLGDTYPNNLQALVQDAVRAADPTVDFRQYDNDGPDGLPNSGDDDGFVDAVIVVFSGYAAESYSPANGANRLWSSAGWLDWGWRGPGPMTTVDGPKIQLYAVSSELRNTSGATIRDIGVYCHEFGHLLGAPDMYSTVPASLAGSLGQWNGLGEYSVMAFGGWGAGGTNPDRPTHFSGFEKALLGWITPVHVTVDLLATPIADIEASGTIYCDFPWLAGGAIDWNLAQRFWCPSWTKWPPPIEGFIVENRQATGFDSQLSGSGLLIYHMDGRVSMGSYFNSGQPYPNWFANAIEWSENQPLLDVECADQAGADHTFNADDLDAQNNLGDAGDYFASSAAGFGMSTNPSSISYGGGLSNFAVRNIGPSGATVVADLVVGAPPGPGQDIWVKDCPRDTGATPSSPACDCPGYRMLFSSPDLWVDNDEDGRPDQPIQGGKNKLFIKVRNRGTAGIDYGTVRVYDQSICLAPPRAAMPEIGNPFWGLAQVCSLTVQSLAAGDSATFKTTWIAPPTLPPPNWNYPPSLGIVVQTALDPLNGTGDMALDNNLAMVSGRQLWIRGLGGKSSGTVAANRKLMVLSDGDAPAPVFPPAALAAEPEPQPATMNLPLNNPFEEARDIEFTVEADLPMGWTVEAYLPEYLPGPPVPLPFVLSLEAGQVTPLQVVVTPDPAAMHGDGGSLFVAEYDPATYPEGMLGGMTVPVEVDLYAPQPVMNASVELAERDSDVPWRYGAWIAFEPVQYDVAGFLENGLWYGAFRDTVPDWPPDLGEPFDLIAWDMDPETPWWEYLDVDFPIGWPEPPPHYHLVAFDAAGNESEVSPAFYAPASADYATLDPGNVRLTVTDQGICGYMEVPGRGQGLQYPKGSASVLWTGGLWAGVDADRVASRDYEADPEKDWERSESPDGKVQWAWPPDWIPPAAVDDEVVTTIYRDTGGAAPMGLVARQTAVASATAPDDDYVILRYRITNESPVPWCGHCVGQFLDLDLGDPTAGAPWNNEGATDFGRNLAYMWATDGPLHVGVKLLQPALGNVAFIHNPTYVHPQDYVLEADKYGFLSGSDPAHSLSATTGPDEWSLCLSSEPIDLQPGATIVFAVAIVAGDDLADLQANADAAQVHYEGLVTGAGPGDGETPGVPAELVVTATVPNPFNPLTRIDYGLPRPGRVVIEVFNLLGRRVAVLLDGRQDAGPHSVAWNAEHQPSGAYLLRIRAGGEEVSRKLMLVK